MEANENWKSITGYEGLYEVSDLGRVRSLNYKRTGKTKILKPGKAGVGYLVVNFCKDGQVKRMGVHRLVAEAFIPNPLNLPQVNHKDENKQNNAASNLEWMTVKDNTTYSQGRSVQMLDKATGELLATFPSIREAERVTGIWHNRISYCCLGKRKQAGGFKWQYA